MIIFGYSGLRRWLDDHIFFLTGNLVIRGVKTDTQEVVDGAEQMVEIQVS